MDNSEIDDDPALVALTGSEVFGETFATAEAYAFLLVGRAAEWGLMGPREAGRVWSRHIFNSVALAPLLLAGSSVADVGSGAGLPGLPLAIARPDLHVTLIESLQRRARFLRLAVDELGLADRVTVEHNRAEQVGQTFDVVVSRAVAPLGTLIPWCLGITTKPGNVLAMRGSQVKDEVAEYVAKTPRMRSRTSLEVLPATGSAHPLQVVRVTA